ncbi:MAG: hypothetical protein U9R73_13780 [Pseudomonadota bacterium]|jgi:hypothetical protein|nr:hypothetical protein [Pseudomonadota bacterium]
MKSYPMAGANPRARRLRREATVFERMLWSAEIVENLGGVMETIGAAATLTDCE